MSWKIKDDAPESLDLYQVAGHGPNDQELRNYRSFEPGQEVPNSFVDPILERMDGDPNDHAHAFLEHDGDRDVPDPPSTVQAPSAQSPHTGPPATNWATSTKEVLAAEIELRRQAGRNIEVDAPGNKPEMVAALLKDDEVRSNPFV